MSLHEGTDIRGDLMKFILEQIPLVDDLVKLLASDTTLHVKSADTWRSPLHSHFCICHTRFKGLLILLLLDRVIIL